VLRSRNYLFRLQLRLRLSTSFSFSSDYSLQVLVDETFNWKSWGFMIFWKQYRFKLVAGSCWQNYVLIYKFILTQSRSQNFIPGSAPAKSFGSLRLQLRLCNAVSYLGRHGIETSFWPYQQHCLVWSQSQQDLSTLPYKS
jgi:hypothetical protein